MISSNNVEKSIRLFLEKLSLIIICIVSGFLLRNLNIVTSKAYIVLNELLLNFFLPILILHQITELNFDTKYILPILVGWIIFVGAFIFFTAVGKMLNFSNATLIITGGISSTSFIGFPIFELLYGNEGLQIGILMSQAGSFLIATTMGIGVASWYSSNRPTISNIFMNLIKFPPFVFFIVALLMNIFDVKFSPNVSYFLEKLSSPYLIIALLSVGLQLNLSKSEIDIKTLSIGLFYKLILAPCLIMGLYYIIFGQQGYILILSVLGAAIGPMNTAAIIAERFNLDGKLASQMVAIGIPLSLPVLYIFYKFLELL